MFRLILFLVQVYYELKKKPRCVATTRWLTNFDCVSDVIETIGDLVLATNSLDTADQLRVSVLNASRELRILEDIVEVLAPLSMKTNLFQVIFVTI